MVSEAETRRRSARQKGQPELEPEFAELVLGPLDELGDTMAEFEGQCINVAGGIPGERVIARIHRYRRRRKEFVSGIVSQVIEPSPLASNRDADTVACARGASGSTWTTRRSSHLSERGLSDAWKSTPLWRVFE